MFLLGGMMPARFSPRHTPESQPCNIPLLSVARLRTRLQLIFSCYEATIASPPSWRCMSTSTRDVDHEAVSREWEGVFGIPRSRDLLAFTNARMGFIRGVEGQPDGLASITIGVEGRDEFNAILDRAREELLCGDGWINMLGVKLYFTCMGEGAKTKL